MECCSLTGRELKIVSIKRKKIAILKELKLQENSEIQFSELRNKIVSRRIFYQRHQKILNKNRRENLILKYSRNEMENALESIGNRVDDMEERISGVKGRIPEMIQVSRGERIKI